MIVHLVTSWYMLAYFLEQSYTKMALHATSSIPIGIATKKHQEMVQPHHGLIQQDTKLMWLLGIRMELNS